MTTKPQHTQGGWNRNIKPASKYNTIFAGRNTHIARLVTDGLTEEEIEANCNLIAAAPELLEALKQVLIQNDLSLVKINPTLVELVEKAIAKAEGAV